MRVRDKATGVWVTFPDGTDPETIDKVMRETTAQGEGVHRGEILPWDRNADGSGGHLNWNSGLPGMIGRAFSTTGKVRRGEMSPMVPDTGQGVTAPEVEEAAGTLGMFGPMSVAAGTGKAIAGAAGMRPVQPVVPTRGQLHSAGSAGFNKARGMGVDYDPAVIAQFASVARAKLDEAGFNAFTAQNTYKILRQLERAPPGSFVQLSGLHTAQQALRKGQPGADRDAGGIVVRALQKFMEDPPPQAVISGPGAEAGRVLREAQGNWAALERSKEVAGKERRARLRAWAANSGLNMDNNLRGRITDLLLDERAMRGFTQEEVKKLEAFVQGNNLRNRSRGVADRLGGGGGFGSFVTLGSGAGGGFAFGSSIGKGGLGAAIGALAPVVGVSAKKLQNALAKHAMKKLDEEIRMRSPLYGTQAMSPLPRPPGVMSRSMQRMPLGLLQARRSGGGGY